MANAKLIPLAGSQIHGFHTMEDLDIGNMMEEAKGRWLRPNEIHALLCNHKHFTIYVKPVNLPKSGTIVLFDRKMLRNFRKDGHNWKKKRDGKTVKEAHEHLKVGNEERIHVYYAHGEDSSTFVRRCYWLLDKTLEHIVLVQYRETQEMQGSPRTPGSSNATSARSDPSTPWAFSEEIDSVVDQAYYNGTGAKPHIGANDTINGHKMTLHEINTLEWDELVVPDDHNNLIVSDEVGEPLKTADSFERWMNYIIADSPQQIYDSVTTPDSSVSIEQESYGDRLNDNHHQSSSPQLIFSITEVSPAWAPSNEETKVLVVGFFQKDHQHVMNSNLYCVCGDASIPAEIIQTGVFRCLVPPHNPGLVNLYLSFDGHNPISLPVAFEYRSPTPISRMNSTTNNSDGKEFQVQMRLAHLLFSTSKSLNILSSKVTPKSLREAKVFTCKTSHIIGSWDYLIKSFGDRVISSPQEKDSLLELTLQNKLLEWLLERVIDGSKISDHDDQGQGVIHLCAILGYTWAIYPFSWAGLSLDYRDKFGWTALHWAAFYGREKMVATLLSSGAKPNLVTDPSSEYPGGRTAADLASKNGYDGLAAYLAEKGLVSHFKDMTIAGNISQSLQCTSSSFIVGPAGPDDVSSQADLYMKDTLTAYRTAADAAARIQAAFREQSYKLQKKEVEVSNTENEARSIIAAMKIQHAFRNHETRKKMAAAYRLQYRFHTWKLRKEFLNMRRQAIKIQAIVRGIRARRQYRKILWSVGVLEKAVLRWRLKRKGFRGLQVNNTDEATENTKQENKVEEDFFHASRKQAEERVERSVVRVQAMFRSKKAQEEYQMMKQAHYEAMLEYEGLNNPAIDMEK